MTTTNNNTLLPGETLVMASENDALILTTKRVKYEVVSRSRSKYKSIPLNKVSAYGLDTRSYPIFLALSALAVLVIFVAPEVGQRIGAAIASVLLVLAYFFSRNGQIEIFSDSGESIAVPTKGLTHNQVRTFLEAIAAQYELARLDRSK